MNFKSCAQWPDGTIGMDNEITDDLHDTYESASGVVDLLQKNGFGGDKKVFPYRVWVMKKCQCMCHTEKGVMHIKACCDNGWKNTFGH